MEDCRGKHAAALWPSTKAWSNKSNVLPEDNLSSEVVSPWPVRSLGHPLRLKRYINIFFLKSGCWRLRSVWQRGSASRSASGCWPLLSVTGVQEAKTDNTHCARRLKTYSQNCLWGRVTLEPLEKCRPAAMRVKKNNSWSHCPSCFLQPINFSNVYVRRPLLHLHQHG